MAQAVFYGRYSAADIVSINARLAGNLITYPPEAYVIRTDDGAVMSLAANQLVAQGFGGSVVVGVSRALTRADHGKVLEMGAGGLTLTINADALQPDFRCVVMPLTGNTSIARGTGVLLNGATSTVVRAAATNALFGIAARTSVGNSYVVDGTT